jgi:hypothetical protein
MDLPAKQHAAIDTFSATLPFLSDAERERVRLRLGTAFIEHVADLWPQANRTRRRNGSGRMWMTSWRWWMYRIGDDGKPESLPRVPYRMHWLLWLLGDLPDWVETLGQVDR